MNKKIQQSVCLLSPSGNITFVSKLNGWNVCDKYITEDSGVLEFIEEADDIMADRGFTIRDLVTQHKRHS